jgi:endonuclease/exonuclease/phosphatase family metal-dependent hydrolase
MAGAQGGRARVMTWNVWWRFGPRWRDRQPGLVETLRRVDPDIVALQEVWATDERSWVHEIAEIFGLHAGFASPSYPAVPDPPQTPDDAGVKLGLGILSRWPIISLRPVETPARHRDWAPVALTAKLAHPAGPLPVVVACMEYESAYNDDRLAQAQKLAELATDPVMDGPCPVVVAGDLNAPPDSPVLRPLQDLLTDAWTAGNGDRAAVTLPSQHPAAPLEAGPELVDQRIDHIFFRPGQPRMRILVESAFLAGEPVEGVYPSDHQAVVCDLRWATV